MNVKIIKFKNSPIECNFENTNIDCYQEGACKNISSNNYRQCTDDEINEILENKKNEVSDGQSNSDNKNNSNSENENNNGILIGSIIGIGIIIILASVVIVKKINKNNKLDGDSDIEIYERKNQNNSSPINSALNDNSNPIIGALNDKSSPSLMNNKLDDKDFLMNIKAVVNNDFPMNIKIVDKEFPVNIKLNNKHFPTVDSSNYPINDNSILPSYSQLENSHAVQPYENIDIESKILLKTKKAALNEKN